MMCRKSNTLREEGKGVKTLKIAEEKKHNVVLGMYYD
jgi:hypothetical protein